MTDISADRKPNRGARGQGLSVRRKRAGFATESGEAEADAVRDALLRGAGIGPGTLSSALARADETTRARAVGRLQQERGNSYVQRVVAQLGGTPATAQLLPGSIMVQRQEAKGAKSTAQGKSTAEEEKDKEREALIEKATTQATLTEDETQLLELRGKGKSLSKEERKELRVLIRKLGGKKGEQRARVKSAIEKDLEDAGTTPAQWFAKIVPDATFLGMKITATHGSASPGVHQELNTVLQAAEGKLMNALKITDKGKCARKIGLYGVGGLRPPKPATGGSRPSMHCYGLAIDINARGNPFVGRSLRSTAAIQHATLLLRGEAVTVTDAASAKAGAQWERLHAASEDLRIYLSLREDGNKEKLAALVTLRQQAGDTRDVAGWKAQIEEDYKAIAGKGDFAGQANPARSGFMDLDKALVEALTAAGLSWGGQYPGAKDIMHFDLRGGTIRR
jgi:hypothetical protein